MVQQYYRNMQFYIVLVLKTIYYIIQVLLFIIIIYTSIIYFIDNYNNDLISLNSNLIKTAIYSQEYTVSAGAVRTVTVTLNDLKLTQQNTIGACIAVNSSNNASLYNVSNMQWTTGIGSKVFICNNSNVQANIPISFIAFYN